MIWKDVENLWCCFEKYYQQKEKKKENSSIRLKNISIRKFKWLFSNIFRPVTLTKRLGQISCLINPLSINCCISIEEFHNIMFVCDIDIKHRYYLDENLYNTQYLNKSFMWNTNTKAFQLIISTNVCIHYIDIIST